MNIWNKILVGFIFVAAVPFFYLAARALKTHQYWGSQAYGLQHVLRLYEAYNETCENGGEVDTLDEELQQAEADLGQIQQAGRLNEEIRLRVEAREQKVQKLTAAKPLTPQSVGIRQLKVLLHELLVDRGRVWHNCSPQQVALGKDPQTGEQTVQVSLTTDLPDPHGIAVQTVLFIFEEAEPQKGGSYLGQFTVTDAPGKNLQLRPSMRLDARELKRLQASKGPWALYELMPADQHEVLTELSEGQLRAMLPDSTEEEYVKDSWPPNPDDPESQRSVRKLRDYEVLFGADHRQRSVWMDQMEAATRDLKALESALADARQQVQFRQEEIDQLKQESAAIARERDAWAAHRKALETTLAAVNKEIETMVQTNQALAGQIAWIQLEATRRIDEQTQRMVRAGGT